MLEAFIREYFQCDIEPPDLSVNNSLVYPMRLALGPGGNLYVSDPKIGSVFIYDSGLSIVAELKGLDKTLGLAVDDQGNIYVGNNGRRNVEIYDASGLLTATICQTVSANSSPFSNRSADDGWSEPFTVSGLFRTNCEDSCLLR